MKLRIQLLSDTSFGRGDGLAGVVDSEVEHDSQTGMPFVKGRTIKGILVESCADILYSLQKSKSPQYERYEQAAQTMFGLPGSRIEDTGALHVGAAELPKDLQARIRQNIKPDKYHPSQVLEALTTVRYQTAVDAGSERPKDNSLRAVRAVLRETIFYSELNSDIELSEAALELLAASVAGMKRAGESRSRGRGQLLVRLVETSKVDDYYLAAFIARIKGV